MSDPNLIDKLSAHLSPPARRALHTLTSLARRRRLALYLVGGAVRDLLLGADTLDLDLTLEGDAPSLAREAAAALGARCVVHPAFLTATLKGEGFVLDLATARTETYARPGALPAVSPASIREDLLRRDFTVNATALPLTGPRRGHLVDPAGGRADLEAGLLRVLHERSFVDDATRILRAARYELRFGFRLGERTLAWLKRDAAYLATISGARLRQELARIFAEREPEPALLRLDHLGALTAVHPSLTFDAEQAAALARLRSLDRDVPHAAAWALLAWALDEGQAAALAGRLALTRPQAQALCALPRLRALAPDLVGPDLRTSQAVEALSPYPAPAVWALAAATSSDIVRDRCLAYLRHFRYAKSSLDGHALLALGVAPGPAIGDVLRRLKVAKLDGEVKSRRDEERLVRSLLSSSPKASLQADGPSHSKPRTSLQAGAAPTPRRVSQADRMKRTRKRRPSP
ncbi:MAG TPA: hypothetical protein VFT91_10785 [Dehalococcoidia bacterium]|nr:hypothetical protein [Dehalococcoidia bacterium]